MKKFFTCFLLTFSLLSANGQLATPSEVVFPDPRKINENYRVGSSLAGVPGFLAVGAPTANNEGLVYLFQKQGIAWNVVAILRANNGAKGAEFGFQVAMDSNTVVVSCAPAGSAKPVYVFQKPNGGWTNMTETAILHASDSTSGDWFGKALCIQNNHIFVGAPRSTDGGNRQGGVYVYQKNGPTWTSASEDRKIVNPNALIDDEFGYSLALEGNQLLVGTPREWTSGLKGRAYLFKTAGTWTQGALTNVVLTASNGAYGDRFGHAVAMKGSDIVISAPYFDGVQTNTGRLYQFSKPPSGWLTSTESSFLNAPPSAGTFTRNFGDQLHLTNTAVFVSAMDEEDTKGGVFVYNKSGSGWSTFPDFQKINSNGSFGDKLGQGIWVDGDEFFAGKPGEDLDLTNEGTIEVYTKNDVQWNGSFSESALNPPPTISYAEENFGASVDMEGDLMVVGAPNTDLKGVAYVKEFDGTAWNTLAILRASNGYDSQHFGHMVKIDGDWIAVVSGLESWDTSIIYMFKKPVSGWTNSFETCQIRFSGGGNFKDKVQAFDLENGTMVASCTRRKRAFVFEKGTGDWTANHVPIAGLQEPFSSINGFGYALKIENDVIVLTDPYRMINAHADKGAVLVYEKPSIGWADMVSTAILTYADQTQSLRLGMSVDIEGDLIVAGCPFFTSPQYNTLAGAGVVFKRNGANWTSDTEVATLNYSNIPYNYHLGASVAIENNKIYLGADWANTTNTAFREGSFMVFDNNFLPDWEDSYERSIVYGPTGIEHEVFGSNLLVQGSRIVLGSKWRDSIGHNTGAVYTYESCYSGSYTELSVCGSYTWVDGITYTESPDTTLESVITSQDGCDSLVYLDLNIYNFTAGIADSSGWLTASPQGQLYAWYDCDSDQVLTPFFHASQYFPTHDGSFAVIIMDGNCIDTSDCISYNYSGLKEIGGAYSNFHVYPNPNQGSFSIQVTQFKELRMYTTEGKQVPIYFSEYGNATEITLSRMEDGIYFLVGITDDGQRGISKVVIEKK